MLTVYVDDLLLSGPEKEHQATWEKIKSADIKLGDVEPLNRFLGRMHIQEIDHVNVSKQT